MYWIIGIVLLIAAAFIFLMFAKVLFPTKYSQYQISRMKDYIVLTDGIKVVEVPNSLSILHSKFRPKGTSVVNPFREILVNKDNKFEEGKRVYDGDERKEVLALNNDSLNYHYVLTKGKVFEADREKVKELKYEFKEPALGYIRYASPIHENSFLMIADLKEPKEVDSRLFQVNKSNLETIEIDSDPYYSFVRSPLVFSLEGNSGEVVVYYSGSISFAYGGDSSRPHWSTIRIYNEQNPNGLDIAKMSLAAGTIVNVELDGKDFIITTDPSLPSMANVPRVKPRTWKLIL